MPLYSFVDDWGFEVEVYFSMADAPEIGATIEHEGQTLVRVPSQQGGVVREYRHVARSLPRVNKADPYWHKYDDLGRPVFTSKKDVEELSSRIAHMGGKFSWS